MIRRTIAIALALLVSSCASTRPEPASALEPLERFAYSAAIPSVPAGAASVEVSVDVPGDWNEGTLELVEVRGISGNAMFAAAQPGFQRAGGVLFGWSNGEADGRRVQKLVVSGAGRPLEVTLALTRAAGAPADPAALEAALKQRTTVLVDDLPAAAVDARLRRVN